VNKLNKLIMSIENFCVMGYECGINPLPSVRAQFGMEVVFKFNINYKQTFNESVERKDVPFILVELENNEAEGTTEINVAVTFVKGYKPYTFSKDSIYSLEKHGLKPENILELERELLFSE